MEKPVCHVYNLNKSALSGYVSVVDAIATGGHYLSPDESGGFDASSAHDLCVSCANCGSVVLKPGPESPLTCPDCGLDEFHVVQTEAPAPRRPSRSQYVQPSGQTNPSPRVSDDDAGDSSVVNPWARWAARMLDFYLETILSAFVVGIFFEVIGCDTENMSEFGWMFFGIPLGMALDALCHHLLGWSLGKWLFAVKIRHLDGSRLTFAEYFKRNFWVLVKGFGLCIPIVVLVTEIIQYRRVRDGKAASYDEGNDVKVVRVRHGDVRTVFGVVALVALFLLMGILSNIK